VSLLHLCLPGQGCSINACLPGNSSSAGLACYFPTQQWQGAEHDLLPLLSPDPNWLEVAPTSPKGGGPAAPRVFSDACTQTQGEIWGRGGGPDAVNLNRVLVPASAGGWICHGSNAPSWSYLSSTFKEYKGGGAGCDEIGLEPLPGGPLGPVATRVVSFIGGLIPSGPSAASWDGSYNMTTPPNTPAHDGPNGHWYNGPWDCIGGQYISQQGGSWTSEFPSPVVVSGNSVAAQFGTLRVHIPIDSTGQGQYVVTGTSLHYSFTRAAAGVAQVSATISIGSTVGPPPSPVAGGGVVSHGFGSCTATYTGTRG